VAISERRFDARTLQGTEGIQIHISFVLFLMRILYFVQRRLFLERRLWGYGIILDVSVKEYQNYRDQHMQEGYWLSYLCLL
jgi:hypothetical protein